MKYSLVQKALVASTLLFSSSNAISLTIGDEQSVRDAAATAAYGLMANYKNNQSTTAPGDIGTFAMPVYWWNAGAIWGGMVDYATYTGDQSYNAAISQALAANIGEKADLILESKRGQEGNDDQAFWALSIMSAAEADMPAPEGKPAWKDVCANAFDSLTSRWDTQNCGGGLFWQIYPDNFHGLTYKNSVANGGLFQLGARLALLTKDNKYVEWADRVWDWTTSIGFIGDDFTVYDGAGIDEACTRIDQNTWTYNTALFTYGAAVMYDHTKDQKWLDRTNGLVKAAGRFFNQHADAPNVMTEIVCEHVNCNMDQQSFKAYLSRWLAKTSVMVPETAETIRPWLEASAEAAAQSCTGENNACGQKWYVDGFDGITGVNQQLCAMEVMQSLIVSREKMYGQQELPVIEIPQAPASSEVPVAPAPSAEVPQPPPSSENPPPVQTPAPSSEAPAPSIPEPSADSPAPPPADEAASSVNENTAVLPTAVETSTPPQETAAESSCTAETVTETRTETAVIPAETAVASVCESSVVVTVTETQSSFTTVLPTPPIAVHESSSLVKPTLPTPVLPTPGTPTPTPIHFEGAATKGQISGLMYTVFGSMIASAMFL